MCVIPRRELVSRLRGPLLRRLHQGQDHELPWGDVLWAAREWMGVRALVLLPELSTSNPEAMLKEASTLHESAVTLNCQPAPLLLRCFTKLSSVFFL